MPTTRQTPRRPRAASPRTLQGRGAAAAALALLVAVDCAAGAQEAGAQDRVTLQTPLSAGPAGAAGRYENGQPTVAFLVPSRTFVVCPMGAGVFTPCSGTPLKAGARVPGRMVVKPLSAPAHCRCAVP